MLEFTVFLSSPSDVSKERKLISKVINEINNTHGGNEGYQLKLWKYEDEAYPSGSRPQELINQILPNFQIFIGIMWKRFGTPTEKAQSGTEEEFNFAWEAWKNKQVKEIMFYFSQCPYLLTTLDEVEQLRKVISFRDKFNENSFSSTYKDVKEFEATIKKHLCNFMKRKVEESKRDFPRAKPEKETIDFFKQIWNRMDDDLQRLFNIAYNENRMKGDPGIQTRDLFAAMLTQPTKELSSLIQNIPSAGLPVPFEGNLVSKSYIVNEHPWLSHCISSSIKRLGKSLAEEEKITPTDIFVDIARNGTGESVRLLREHQVDAKKIEEIILKEKLDVRLV